MKMIRNAAFGILLVVANIGAARNVFAASCENIDSSYQYANVYNCGPYDYENDALPDMRAKAGAYVQAYNWGDGVYQDPYWWSRITPFDAPGYYDSAWPVCPTGWCW